MSLRQNQDHKSQRQAESQITRRQGEFGLMFKDMPPSEIGNIDVAHLENMISYPKYLEGRTGSKRWSSTDLPSLMTGLTASKTGDVITRTAGGTDFDSSYMYNRYFVWADGTHDEIIAYTDANTLQVRTSGDRASTAGGWIRSSVFGLFYHRKLRKVIMHIDTRLFWADYAITSWTEIPNVSRETMAENLTAFNSDDNYVYAINNDRIFKIALDEIFPYYYQANAPVPQTLIEDVAETDEKVYGRRYVYTMTRFRGGNYLGSRTGDTDDSNVELLTIEQESGSTAVNTSGKDYGERFTQYEIGKGNETYGRLVCAEIEVDISAWQAISDGSFTLSLNGSSYDIMCDFSNVFNMDDVALIVGIGIKVYDRKANVYIDPNSGTPRLVIETSKVDGNTITVLSASGIGGTDISGAAYLNGAAGTVSTPKIGVPTRVNNLIAPPSKNAGSGVLEQHWTHFSVYGTRDTGINGTDNITGIGNSPELYTWIDDIPIIKAFTITATEATKIAHADTGRFIQSDVGNLVHGESLGFDSFVIDYLCDAAGTQVYTSTSLYAYSGGSSPIRADIAGVSATIGTNRKTLTLTQTNHAVVRASGDRSFAATDIGKTIFWADGGLSIITDYTDGDNVTVLDLATRASQGAGIDPWTSGRPFNDSTSDLVLKNRFEFFSLQWRFYTHVPKCNIGTIVPGFLAVGSRNGDVVYYSPLPRDQKYIGGYYYASRHFDDKMEDDIQAIERYPDKLAIICSNTTYVTPTNSPLIEQLDNIGISIALLPNLALIANIGCTQVGSITNIDVGKQIMRTNEPAVRVFDGFRYTEANLSELQVERYLKKMTRYSVSHYDPISGWILWGAEEED